MNLLIEREQLAAGLAVVAGITAGRVVLPILSNVLLRAEAGRLHLTTSDLDVYLSTSVAAVILQPGTVTVPSKKLGAFINALNEGEVDLHADDKAVLTILSGSSKAKVRGLEAKEFPPVPDRLKEGKFFTLDRAALNRILALTIFAISNDESRYVLNGLHFKLAKGRLTIESTDGRRLARCVADCDQKLEGDFIVPVKAVNELKKLAAAGGEQSTLEIGWNGSSASFAVSNDDGIQTLLTTKLIEGGYPNSDAAIPKDFQHKIAVERELFIAAVRRANLMTTEKQGSVVLAFTRNNLEVRSAETPVGQAKDQVALNYKGKDLAIAFNPDYLLDAAGAVSTDDLTLNLIDNLSPGVITGDEGFLCVIMPMRDTSATEPAAPAAPAAEPVPPAEEPKAEAISTQNPKAKKKHAHQPEQPVAAA